jgi:molybdate transport system substrate-binding protein
MRRRAVLAAAATLLLFDPAVVWGGEIRVLCSNGLKAVVEQVRPEFERTSGHTLSVEFSSAATLRQRILSGAPFDVALLTADVVDDLIATGRLAAATRTRLARSGIGLGVRRGNTKPDVRTSAALKQALLDAESLVYARDGASRSHIDRMLKELGIDAAMQPKTTLVGPGEATERVSKGQSAIVITLISEILPVQGIELAGPLPPEYQQYVTFVAAGAGQTAAPAAVQALIAYLDGPAAAASYRIHGMEPY